MTGFLDWGGDPVAQGAGPGRQGTLNQVNPAHKAIGEGVPAILTGRKMAAEGSAGAPPGITVQANGPNVTFKQAPPNVSISVVVNATSSADPGAIGAAAAGAVGAKVRGALQDGGHQ